MRSFTTEYPSHTLINYIIIVLQIKKEIYSQYTLPQEFSCFICPACESVGDFKYHSKYKKYHYDDLIIIYVLKCCFCKKHHALIPSFSIPGTSLGTEEVEQYVINREEGYSRKKQVHSCWLRE